MKTRLAAALASLPFLALAAPSPTAPNDPEPTQELKTMTDRLNLTPDQQARIAPILVAEAKERKSVEDNTTLGMQAKFVQIGIIHRAALQQIKAVFTPEQMAMIEQGQNHPGTSPTHP